MNMDIHENGLFLPLNDGGTATTEASTLATIKDIPWLMGYYCCEHLGLLSEALLAVDQY